VITKSLRFNFHKWKDFKECPKRFYLKETRVPYPKEENKYNTLVGNTVQKFFELYTNEWKDQPITWTRDEVVERIEGYWKWLLAHNYINWRDFYVKFDKHQLFGVCIDIILENIQKMDVYDNTRSEVKIEVKFKSGDVLVGIIDFIKKKSGKIIVFDGKSTDKIGKNIHIEQLYTYAILYQFKNKVMPDELAFLYFRMQAWETVPVDLEKIELFKKDLIYTMYLIKKMTVFPATPTAKGCMYCPYKTICEEHMVDAKTRRRKSAIKDDTGGSIITLDF
jgi:CRISPR/Cas system-associated exonuclease Cas4 (RecB family)